MFNRLIISLRTAIHRLEQAIFGNGPSLEMALAAQPCHAANLWKEPASERRSALDLLGDCILWAVPKHRTRLEKRTQRKFGDPAQYTRMIQVKKNLQYCPTCGNDHELGILCPFCYERVLKETSKMQERIQKKLDLDPIEKEVVVIYQGESSTNQANECLVEMTKRRPQWFTRNLLQPSTAGEDTTTTDVVPSDKN